MTSNPLGVGLAGRQTGAAAGISTGVGSSAHEGVGAGVSTGLDNSTNDGQRRLPVPDAATQQRFESLLKVNHQPIAPVTLMPGPLSGGFGLLAGMGQAMPLATSHSYGSLPSSSGLQQLADQVSRVLVSDDAGGSRQVRLDLDDEHLPGVSFSVEEHEGRWVVCFVCRQEPPRLRLTAEAQAMAATLAERLARETLVQVRTDDDEDPCLVEALGMPHTTSRGAAKA